MCEKKYIVVSVNETSSVLRAEMYRRTGEVVWHIVCCNVCLFGPIGLQRHHFSLEEILT